jgi:hypothetical protein
LLSKPEERDRSLMSPGSWFPCFTTCPPSNPFSLFLEIVLMRDLGDGPRGVAVFLFLSIAFASRLDDNWDHLRPATRQLDRLVTFRSVHVSLLCLFATRLRGKLLAAKEAKQLSLYFGYLMGQQFRHTATTSHLHTPSPVTARLYSTSLNN